MIDFLSPQKEAEENNVGAGPELFAGSQEKQLIIRDPFDPSFIPAIFKPFHAEIDRMANTAQAARVTTDEELETVTLLTNQTKQLEKAIEKTRVQEKEPYLKVTSVLDSETKGLKDRLLQIKKHLDGLITPFLQKKEAERRDAERKAQAERDRIQKELDDKAQKEREAAADEARKKAEAEGLSKKQAEEAAKQAAAMVEDAPVIVMDAPAETKVQTEAGSAKIKDEWTFEIMNCAGLPTAAYIARNEQVKAALSPWVSAQVKAGIREISGVRIFKAVKLETRAAKRGTSQGIW